MKYRHISYVLSILLSVSSMANAETNSDDLNALLENMSDLATKKSLNIDYLPSVVSTVDAHIYLDAGIKNLGEALGMLPGFQMQMSPMGYTMTTVRGFKNPNAYLSDKIKILIDGVAINNEVMGSSSFYMDFPLELVEKIEVLRGPNSTTAGSGAFYGTVNVITKIGNSKQENSVYVGGGSYETLFGAAHLYSLSENWKIFADAYITHNNKALRVENTTVKTDESMRDVGIGIRLTNGKYEINTRYKQSIYGNFYSFEEGLDPIPTSPKEHKNSYFLIEASSKDKIGTVNIGTKLAFSHRELDEEANIDDISLTADRFAAVGIDMQEGFYFTEKMKEQNFEVETIAEFPKIGLHDIVGGVGLKHTRIPQDKYYNSVENTIAKNVDNILASPNYNEFRFREEREPAYWANPTTSFIKEDISRTVGYLYLQDLISLNEDVDFILGARMDHFSDLGNQLSQRAGIVYRATDKTVLKLLYGSAYRAPTLTEAYANGHINYRAGLKDVKSEETDTYEAVILYKPDFDHRFSLDIFYSKLKNVIDLEEYYSTIPGYQNYNDRISKGIEFEYNYHHAPEHDFYFNASYIRTDYQTPPEEESVSVKQSMPDISKTMFKALYVYHPTDELSFGTAWQFYSRTTQSELNWITEDGYDTTVHPQHKVDQTVTYRFAPSSELRATVKNVFNSDIRLPSYYYNTPGGILREGRNFYISFVHKF